MFAIAKTSEGWVVRQEETGRVVVGPCVSHLEAEAEYEAKAPRLWQEIADDRAAVVEAVDPDEPCCASRAGGAECACDPETLACDDPSCGQPIFVADQHVDTYYCGFCLESFEARADGVA